MAFSWIFGGNPTVPPPVVKPPVQPPTDQPPPVTPPAQPMTDRASYTRTFPDLNGSSITTKINSAYPECTYQDANSIDVTIVDNYAQPMGGGGIGAEYINHVVNNRTIGGESRHHGVDLQSDLKSGFNISHTQITHAKRMMGGYADSMWFNSFGPNSNFATTPDANGIIHRFDSGGVRIGELNPGNAWGDFGMVIRGVGSRWVAGLELFPDWLPGSDGDQKARHYHDQWAYGAGGAGADAHGNTPKWWQPFIVFTDGVVGKNDHAKMLPGAVPGNSSGGGGYAWTINGSSDPSNPIGKGIHFAGYMDQGLDFREANFTQGEGPLMLADDQPIKLGSVWLRGHQGQLQASANGTTWRNL